MCCIAMSLYGGDRHTQASDFISDFFKVGGRVTHHAMVVQPASVAHVRFQFSSGGCSSGPLSSQVLRVFDGVQLVVSGDAALEVLQM